ncbi:MAG: NAD+ synthase [Gemmatimonadota bacterium]
MNTTLDVAIAQFRPTKGDVSASLDAVQAVLAEAVRLTPRPGLVVFPESALTGYFLEGGVREHARPAGRLLEELRERYARVAEPSEPLDVAIGFYEVHEQRIYNAALYAELGGQAPRILHIHRKVFLPTYGVFQEERFVEAGSGVQAFDTRWGRAALLICEDAFHSVTPTLAALDGAELILVPSASPARGTRPGSGLPGNLERWDRLASAIAAEHGVHVIVAQLVGFEGGKGFPGGSTAWAPRRRLLRGPLWKEAILPVPLEKEELFAARVEEPLLADLEAAWPRLLEGSPGAASPRGEEEAEPVAPRFRPGPPLPEAGAGAKSEKGRVPTGRSATAGTAAADEPAAPDPEDLTPLAIDTALVEEWLLEFLRDEIRRRRGFERVVVGVSGGVDSALTATLCARALGPDAVTGFLLPYRTSSEESGAHARLVAQGLGIEAVTVEITDAVDGYLERYDPQASDHRRGNVAARQRMIVLFDQAARLNALPVGTGNKSERLLGYFTWHADDSPPINPLGDLFKTQVWELARALELPREIVEKPATADLIRGQTDEEDLGISYPEADLILHWLLAGYTPERLARRGFRKEKIEIVRRRLEGTHWKRHLPTVAMLSSTAIGEWYLRPVDY